MCGSVLKKTEISETCQMHTPLLYYHAEPFAKNNVRLE